MQWKPPTLPGPPQVMTCECGRTVLSDMLVDVRGFPELAPQKFACGSCLERAYRETGLTKGEALRRWGAPKELLDRHGGTL